MFKYGKTTENAISAMSRLAELYDGGETRVSSGEIAKVRNLPKTLVAKLLTILSQADLVAGSPGPGGGYTLARAPEEISLFDVVSEFERIDRRIACPFGPGWCGHGDPCPLHNRLVELDETFTNFLQTTTLDIFTKAYREKQASEAHAEAGATK